MKFIPSGCTISQGPQALWSNVVILWPDVYYRLDVSVPPNSHLKVLILNISVYGAFGRCLGHEDRSPMNGISALIKVIPECSLPCSTTWGHSKMPAVYEPGSGSLLDTKSAGTWISDYPTPRKIKKKCVFVFISSSVWVLFYSSLDMLRQPLFCSECSGVCGFSSMITFPWADLHAQVPPSPCISDC